MFTDIEPLIGELNNEAIFVPTGNYPDLTSKPSINGVELIGNKTSKDLNIEPYDDSEVKQDINNLDIEVDNLTENMNTISDEINSHNENINELEQKTNKLESDLLEQESTINHLDDIKADKETTYTKEEVIDLLSKIEHLRLLKVDDLPEIGEENIIYLVKRPDEQFDDIYNEYIWSNNQYNLVGNTKIDLSNYYTKIDVDDKVKGLATTSSLIAGINGCEPKMADSVDYVIETGVYGDGESGPGE